MEPEHLGANEYLGELYLEMKQKDKAQGAPRGPVRRPAASCEVAEELRNQDQGEQLTESSG